MGDGLNFADWDRVRELWGRGGSAGSATVCDEDGR